jgi:hypothetical protein
VVGRVLMFLCSSSWLAVAGRTHASVWCGLAYLRLV